MDDIVKRWQDAAERYRIATEMGAYGSDRKSMQQYRDEVNTLEKLLGNFFDWENPRWEAASEMLKCSGKEIELIRWDKQPFLVRLILSHERFRVVCDMGLPLGLGRKIKPAKAGESLWYITVAALLVDQLLPRLRNVENIMQFLIEKIDEVADDAPDEP